MVTPLEAKQQQHLHNQTHLQNQNQPILKPTHSKMKRCVHCGTSDTPLWRVGPGGPKSLCNACGLRWRKTGRITDSGESVMFDGHGNAVVVGSGEIFHGDIEHSHPATISHKAHKGFPAHLEHAPGGVSTGRVEKKKDKAPKVVTTTHKDIVLDGDGNPTPVMRSVVAHGASRKKPAPPTLVPSGSGSSDNLVERVDATQYPLQREYYWPPAVEAFRKSATMKAERVYTLDDFWPYYHNVFSGLMVVHKTHR